MYNTSDRGIYKATDEITHNFFIANYDGQGASPRTARRVHTAARRVHTAARRECIAPPHTPHHAPPQRPSTTTTDHVPTRHRSTSCSRVVTASSPTSADASTTTSTVASCARARTHRRRCPAYCVIALDAEQPPPHARQKKPAPRTPLLGRTPVSARFLIVTSADARGAHTPHLPRFTQVHIRAPAQPRFSIGVYATPCGPTYAASGRNSRLPASCSMMCPAHPARRLSANIGVNRSSSSPMQWYVVAE